MQEGAYTLYIDVAESEEELKNRKGRCLKDGLFFVRNKDTIPKVYKPLHRSVMKWIGTNELGWTCDVNHRSKETKEMATLREQIRASRKKKKSYGKKNFASLDTPIGST